MDRKVQWDAVHGVPTITTAIDGLETWFQFSRRTHSAV